MRGSMSSGVEPSLGSAKDVNAPTVWAWFSPALLLILTGLLLPFAWLAWAAFGHGEVGALSRLNWSGTLYQAVLMNTLRISAMVTLCCAAVGYPLAAALVLSPPRAQRVLLFAIMSSLWLSLLVRSYAWSVLLQSNGPIPTALSWFGLRPDASSLMYTQGAVVAGMVHVLLPVMVLVVWSGMLGNVGFVQDVARSLGATRSFYFIRLFLPGTGGGVMAGCVLVFLLGVGFYITPALLGGGKGETTMYSLLVEEQVNTFGNWSTAAALSLTLLLTVALGITTTLLLPSLRRRWGRIVGITD
jgi:putative spermidine/putrescine transport system permease protein